MSVIRKDSDKEKLYSDLRRVSLDHVADCTVKQVRQVVSRLQSGNDFTRTDLALRLYWMVSERYIEDWPVTTYLDWLREKATMEMHVKECAIIGRDRRGTLKEGSRLLEQRGGVTFVDCLEACIHESEFVAQWQRLNGKRIVAASGLDRMIDQATGYDMSVMGEFADFVYSYVFKTLPDEQEKVSQ